MVYHNLLFHGSYTGVKNQINWFWTKLKVNPSLPHHVNRTPGLKPLATRSLHFWCGATRDIDHQDHLQSATQFHVDFTMEFTTLQWWMERELGSELGVYLTIPFVYEFGARQGATYTEFPKHRPSKIGISPSNRCGFRHVDLRWFTHQQWGFRCWGCDGWTTTTSAFWRFVASVCWNLWPLMICCS